MSIESYTPDQSAVKRITEAFKPRQDHATRGTERLKRDYFANKKSQRGREGLSRRHLTEGLSSDPIDFAETLVLDDDCFNYEEELAAREAEIQQDLEFGSLEEWDDIEPDEAGSDHEDAIPEELLLHTRRRRAKLALTTFSQLDPEADKDFRNDEDYLDGFSITRRR